MKKLGLLFLTFIMTGCVSFQPSIPEGYSGPRATINDTYSNHTGSKAHFYVLTKIDEKSVEDSGYKTRVDNHGRGFNMTPYMVSREVTVDSHVFTIMGFVQFATDGQGMFSDHMMVTKTVNLAPQAGEIYKVAGELNKNGSDVWLEDSNGNKFPGTLKVK